MREDMFKVIVERPRLFRRHARRVKSRYDRQPDRTKVGMRRAALEQRGLRKGLNENLAPLRRYLQKQRGRAWNDVYSEICARLDTRSTVKQHVRDHLEDLIVVKVTVDRDGRKLCNGRWAGLRPLHESWCDLYVDPEDGIIKEVAALRRKLGLPASRNARRRKPKHGNCDLVVLNDLEDLRRIDGLWYRIRYVPPEERPPLHRRPGCCCGPTTKRDDWPIVAKRQLSGAELRARGLCNDVDV